MAKWLSLKRNIKLSKVLKELYKLQLIYRERMNFKCIIFLLLTFAAKAQVNLVPNPSFETYTNCPYLLDQIDYTGNWYMPTTGTSDFYDTCSTNLLSIPVNWSGYQMAHNNGGGYTGLIAYGTDGYGATYREYIQTQLASSLISGQKYYLSFYVSLSDSSRFSADGMGAFVSPNPINLVSTGTTAVGYQAGYTNFTVLPQVSNPQGQILNDITNWKLIAGSFIANGGEQYITIGNFKNNTNTSKLRRLPNMDLGGYGSAYYYIDDVCLSSNAQSCGLNPNVGQNNFALQNFNYYYDEVLKKIIFQNKNEILTIKIIDLFGNEIKILSQYESDQIDMSEIPCGFYIVQVINSVDLALKKIFIH